MLFIKNCDSHLIIISTTYDLSVAARSLSPPQRRLELAYMKFPGGEGGARGATGRRKKEEKASAGYCAVLRSF